MTEKTHTPGATGQRFASVWDALPRDLRDTAPPPGEALMEQSLFDAAQELAAKRGKALKRTATGYRLSWPGVTRHFIDLYDVADFVNSTQQCADAG